MVLSQNQLIHKLVTLIGAIFELIFKNKKLSQMKKSILLLVFLLGTFISSNSQTEANNLIKKIVSENTVMGISAGYSIEGKVIWQSAQGYANKEENVKFDVETRTRTASIAKPMTAIAVLQLLEKGLIDLNKPITSYIPDFPQLGKTKITVKHLLSHTSGVSGYKNGKEAETKKEYENLEEALVVFKNRKLKFEPGTKFSYTTYGYVVLGVLIEKVSGLSFEEYLQKNIWDKAEMTNTGIDKYQDPSQNKSELYSQKKKGVLKKIAENNLSGRIPGGGFYSTTTDLLKFGNAIINHKLIKKETYDLMVAHHSLEKVNNGYGFGWFLYGGSENESAIIGHSGAQTGSSTQLFIVPSKELVVIAMANTSGASSNVSQLAGNLINIALK